MALDGPPPVRAVGKQRRLPALPRDFELELGVSLHVEGGVLGDVRVGVVRVRPAERRTGGAIAFDGSGVLAGVEVDDLGGSDEIRACGQGQRAGGLDGAASDVGVRPCADG